MPRNDLKQLAIDLKKANDELRYAEIRQKVLLPESNALSVQLRSAAPAEFIRVAIGVISKPNRYPLSVAVGIDYSKKLFAANLAYAFEYGTVDRYTKAGLFKGRLTPAPFFRPTVDANRNKIVTNVINSLSKLVEKKLK